MSGMAVSAIVEDDAHGKDGLGPLLEPPAEWVSCGVKFLVRDALLLDDVLSREASTTKPIFPR